MLDCRTEVAARSESSRVLRYILFKFAWACKVVPSFLYISDFRLRTVDVGDGTRYCRFSDVHPGVLDDGSQVAIKRLRIPKDMKDHFVEVKDFLLPLRFHY